MSWSLTIGGVTYGLSAFNVTVRRVGHGGDRPRRHIAPGDVWQSTAVEPRQVQLVIQSRERSARLPSLRRALLEVLGTNTRVDIVYTGQVRTLTLPTRYLSGLEETDSDTLTLSLVAYGVGCWIGSQMLVGLTTVHQSLSGQHIVQRSANGQWTALSALPGAGAYLEQCWLAYHGSTLWILAWFSSPSVYSVYVWNGTAWTNHPTALLAGTNSLRGLAVAPNGDVFVGAATASAAYVRRRPASTGTWATLGTLPSGYLNSVVTTSDNVVYAELVGVGVYRWSGSAWVLQFPSVYGFTVGRGDVLYGLTSTGLGRAVPGATAWTMLPGGLPGGIGEPVYGIAEGRDGLVWAYGELYDHGYIRYHNGSGWLTPGFGLNYQSLGIAFSGTQTWVVGEFNQADTLPIPGGLAIWTGSFWRAADVRLPSGAWSRGISVGGQGQIALAATNTGTYTVPHITTVTNIGNAEAFLSVSLTGPGRVYGVRHLDRQEQVACNLLINSGETITLDMGASTITSSQGRPLDHTLRPGSVFFPLDAGSNRIAIIADPTVTSAGATYVSAYSSWEFGDGDDVVEMVSFLQSTATYAWFGDALLPGATGDWVDVVQGITAIATGNPQTTALNERRAVQFNGAQWFRTPAFPTALLQPTAIVAVSRRTGDVSIARAIHDARVSPSSHLLMHNPDMSMSLFSGSSITAANTSTTALIVTVATCNTTASSLRINGVQVVSGNAGDRTLPGLTMGASFNNTLPFIGQIAMIAVVNGANYAARAAEIEARAMEYYRV